MGLFSNKKKKENQEESIHEINEFLSIIKENNIIEICLYIDHDKIINISKHIKEICNTVIMNGYNWEVLLHTYINKNMPELLDGMDTNSEAGIYGVFYKYSEENIEKTNKLADIINRLIQNEYELYQFIHEYKSYINWE